MRKSRGPHLRWERKRVRDVSAGACVGKLTESRQENGRSRGPPARFNQGIPVYFRLRINTSPPMAKAIRESVAGSGTAVKPLNDTISEGN